MLGVLQAAEVIAAYWEEELRRLESSEQCEEEVVCAGGSLCVPRIEVTGHLRVTDVGTEHT